MFWSKISISFYLIVLGRIKISLVAKSFKLECIMKYHSEILLTDWRSYTGQDLLLFFSFITYSKDLISEHFPRGIPQSQSRQHPPGNINKWDPIRECKVTLTLLIISWTSDSVGFWPALLIAACSSYRMIIDVYASAVPTCLLSLVSLTLVDMVASEFLSKVSKASLNAASSSGLSFSTMVFLVYLISKVKCYKCLGVTCNVGLYVVFYKSITSSSCHSDQRMSPHNKTVGLTRLSAC